MTLKIKLALLTWLFCVSSLVTASPYTSVTAHVDTSTTVARQEFEEHFSSVIKDAIALGEMHVKNNDSSLPIIAITGCSGVGKSYFAQQLLHALKHNGINAKILELDDFLQHDPLPPQALPLHPHFNYIQAHEVLSQICSGQKHVKKPIWLVRGGPYIKSNEVFDLENIDLLIIEGEFAAHGPDTYDFLKYAQFGIFIDAKTEDICKWRFQRGRNNTQGVTLDEYAKKITLNLEKYRQYADPVKKNVRYTVWKDTEHQYKIIHP